MDNYFLDLHHKCLKTGSVPPLYSGVYNGLCGRIKLKYKPIFNLFTPDDDELEKDEKEGLRIAYWGSGLKWDELYNGKDATKAYTPLRQNILLLCHELLNS